MEILISACLELVNAGAWVVAAASNECKAKGARPSALLRAAFDCVLGVGAVGMPDVQRKRNPTKRSNLCYGPAKQGIMAFGGEAIYGQGGVVGELIDSPPFEEC